jgi:hypothetical protein
MKGAFLADSIRFGSAFVAVLTGLEAIITLIVAVSCFKRSPEFICLVKTVIDWLS